MIRRALLALSTFTAGCLFGFGLSYSGMTQPEVVLSFLHFYDAGLMVVLLCAMIVVALTYALAPRLLKRPAFNAYFAIHPSKWSSDTWKGAAIFGVGWGLCGVCPGPAIANLGSGNLDLLWAFVGIVLGALVQGLLAAPAETVDQLD
jgi:uncharacterized membrane protein YedE/YeeE